MERSPAQSEGDSPRLANAANKMMYNLDLNEELIGVEDQNHAEVASAQDPPMGLSALHY